MDFPLNLEAVKQGVTSLEFYLFGYIPIREVNVDVVPEIEANPGGHSIGIKMQSDGVVVVGFYQVESRGFSFNPARSAGLRMGDSIVSIEGKEVADINHTAKVIEEYASQGPVSLTIKRGEEKINTNITPRYCEVEGKHLLGIYIRDTTAGVGTLSFYEPDSLLYGALGHIIIDTDTGSPVDMSKGEIVKAEIININSAQRGYPGEKTGVFLEEQGFRGTIIKNSPLGIFGHLDEDDDSPTPYPDPLPIALASQVEKGPAELLTVIDGETIKSYELEIERVINQSSPADKGMVIKITDEELLENTGGIVQGMSGSPIIQDDKLIGVVTHVFVNDPSRGYALFMEWMVYEAELSP